MPGPLPREVEKLFWEIDPAAVDLDRHTDYVMERVMARGAWEAMCWLRRTFARERLADFLLHKGARLAPRERAYWALVAGVELPAGRGGARPPWAVHGRIPAEGAAPMRSFDRITSNPSRMKGQPCIRDLRLTVKRVLDALATYPDRAELLREYPELEDEDIRQALAYAAAALTPSSP